MNNSRSDFLPNEITAVDISGWADILPRRCRVLAANLFADLFIGDTEGAVHMLEVSAASSAKIAFSEEEFRQRCVNDEDGCAAMLESRSKLLWDAPREASAHRSRERPLLPTKLR